MGVRVFLFEKMRMRGGEAPKHAWPSQGGYWSRFGLLCVRMCFQSTSEILMRQKRGSLMISGINHSQYVQLRSKRHAILNFPE